MNKKIKYHLDTLAIHAGHTPDKDTLSRAVPIYQTSSYVFENSEHAADLFALKQAGNIYTRLMNPTTDVLEKRIAAMEGGVGAVCFASGMAAITALALTLCKAGDHIVSSSSLYGGTYTLFSQTLKKYGIDVSFVDPSESQNFADAIKDNTKLVYIETIGNPKNDVIDYPMITTVAHEAGVLVACDNTVASPMLFRPIEYGVDIVVHSCTKIIGGHGTSIGGIVVDSGKFDFAASTRYPEMLAPDESYHGLKYVETFGEFAFLAKLRTQTLRDMGACISPFNAFLLIQGLETIHLRVPRHCSNALELAKYLESHPAVSWVNYPGLESHRDYARAKKFLPNGQGAIVGFGIKGGKEAGKRFIESVKLASHLANILDSKTLVIHPASTTHQQLSDQEQLDAGVSADYIRVSVGTEHIDDIIADFESALEESQN